MVHDAVTGAATALMPEVAAADFLNSLVKPAHILVAISGGSDSTGLLIALAEQLKSLSLSDVTLSAATIDHGLRAASVDEARDVAALCSRHGIGHFVRRWDGEKPETGIMAAAREARYELLADIARDISATVIVTGHTSDDQQETIVMRAARNVDRNGLVSTGIADALLFDRRIWILRPFLACRRLDIRAYLERQGLSWLDDPSNEDTRYERVRTRRALAQDNLPRPLADGGADRAALSARAALWFDKYVTIHSGALCAIERAGVCEDAAVVTYALSYLAAVFGGDAYGLARSQVARILDFVNEGNPGRRTAGGVVFDLRRQALYLMRERRNLVPLSLPPGGKGLWDGRFEVANHGRGIVHVNASGGEDETALATDLPKGAVRRARAAMPRITVDGEGLPETVTVAPYLAPFDRFLTRFDLEFAGRLSVAFRGEGYMRPPLSVI